MVFQTVPAVEVGFAAEIAEREREKKTETKREEELGSRCSRLSHQNSREIERQRDKDRERGKKRDRERGGTWMHDVPDCSCS